MSKKLSRGSHVGTKCSVGGQSLASSSIGIAWQNFINYLNQISMYQIYCELVLFLTVLIFIAIEKTLFWARIFSFISSTMIYVIHPIFYLFGDKNFRKRVLNQGIWKALKKELFQNNSEIQPVN